MSTVVFQEAYGLFPESQCRVPLLPVSLLDVMLKMQYVSVLRNLLMAVFSISVAGWDLGSPLVAYLAM